MAVVVTASRGAHAQPPTRPPSSKVWRLGYLVVGPIPAPDAPVPVIRKALLDGLAERGYVEGRNLRIEYRFAERAERLPELAVELVRLQVDVIVAADTPAIHAARQATRTIPIVMPMSFDPVEAGLIESLARPGGNVTGVTLMSTALVGKRVELLKEAVPLATRLAIVLGPPTQVDSAFVAEAEIAARRLGLQPTVVRITDLTAFESAFTAMAKAPVSVALVIEHPDFLSSRAAIVDLAAQRRIPAMYGLGEFAEAGGLMSYGASARDAFERAAEYIDRVLRGAKPTDLPVEQPTRFQLAINLYAARALNLVLPRSLWLRADRLIGDTSLDDTLTVGPATPAGPGGGRGRDLLAP